ncbi:MAG TPA: hypothetical protein G4N97_01295 [Thermoflexia bacterium]|nr:hypothetical protein [Thermoflexia bacterium]
MNRDISRPDEKRLLRGHKTSQEPLERPDNPIDQQVTDMTSVARNQNRTLALPTHVLRVARRNSILVLLVLLLVVLTLLQADGAKEIGSYYKLIEWNTVGALAGILIITTGIKESNFLSKVAGQILNRPLSERKLALLLVTLSALLATFLTNDITLLVIIPLTMSLQARLENDISKMIIFEAIAVNIGSALTPVGNPQNLFLWHEWGLSFIAFTVKMTPLVAVLLLLLLLLVRFSFGERELKAGVCTNDRYDGRLLVLSLILLGGYLTAVEFKCVAYALPVIVLVYAMFYEYVLREVDWPVILIFVLMFVDFGLISELDLVVQFMGRLGQMSAGGIFGYATLISQVISNVPAAVLVSRFSDNWPAITYGVNVGGNGIVTASLANLIALRMIGDRKIWPKFHKYSLGYLSVSACLTYLLLCLLLA